MEQSLLTTGAEISKWGIFITTWEGIIKLSKDYYKIGQLHTIKKRGKSYYKVTQVIYCKMGLKNLLPKLHQGVGLKNLLPLPIVLICLLGTRTNSSTCLEIGAVRFESRVLQYVEMALRRDGPF